MKALAPVLALALCGLCAVPASAGILSDGSLFGSDSKNSNADATPAQNAPVDLDSGIRQAQQLRAQGSFQDAAQMLSKLMMAAPDDARIIGEYGKVMVQEGRSADALAFLQRAEQLQPEDWTLYSATGVAYDQSGDFTNAKLAYEHALMLKPGSAVILNNYAMSRVQAGDLAGAQQMLAQAKANGSDPKIAANISFVASLEGGRAQPVAVAASSTVGHSAPTASAPLGAVAATTAPRQVAAGVVMQKVPVDPKAGPVHRAAPARIARTAPRKSAAQVAATTPSLRSGADGLRADASSP